MRSLGVIVSSVAQMTSERNADVEHAAARLEARVALERQSCDALAPRPSPLLWQLGVVAPPLGIRVGYARDGR
jgi:hypothetical protein